MIDLGETNLFGANLKRINLERANLVGTKLVKANLFMANLKKANLIEANLEGANLKEANLKEANFEGAHLQGANLMEANLEGANLGGALNLSIGQLSKVRSLYNVKLDEESLIQLKEEFPLLFKSLKQQFQEYQRNFLGVCVDNNL